jgi:hypothetical protein
LLTLKLLTMQIEAVQQAIVQKRGFQLGRTMPQLPVALGDIQEQLLAARSDAVALEQHLAREAIAARLRGAFHLCASQQVVAPACLNLLRLQGAIGLPGKSLHLQDFNRLFCLLPSELRREASHQQQSDGCTCPAIGFHSVCLIL